MDITPHYKIELARTFRKQPTPSEAKLWKYLRGKQIDGLHFRRQRPIGRFVADFCCESARLIIEIDGGYHDSEEQKTLDTERAAHFTGCGYHIARFTNEQVSNDLDLVLLLISQAAKQSLSETQPSFLASPLPSAGESDALARQGLGEGAK